MKVRALVARLRLPVASGLLECCSSSSLKIKSDKEGVGYTAYEFIKSVKVERPAVVGLLSRPACAGL